MEIVAIMETWRLWERDEQGHGGIDYAGFLAESQLNRVGPDTGVIRLRSSRTKHELTLSVTSVLQITSESEEKEWPWFMIFVQVSIFFFWLVRQLI